MRQKINQISNVKIIAFGFALIILIGALLLMLPISSTDGSSCHFIDALFTATSACCVTGLVVFDTATHWSLFGQIIILLLIQIGGLGFITFTVLFMTFFKKKISLKERNLIGDSISTLKLSGGVKLVILTIRRALIIELIGAIILSYRFIKDYHLTTGIYYGIFHSISAFCNAGFDLFGQIEPYGSLVPYQLDPIVNFTIMTLIVVGGLGFVVWDDLIQNQFRFNKTLLQTKVVLSVSVILILGGTLGIYLLEMNQSLSGYSFQDGLLISLFQSVTCRTAGFNTIDINQFTSASRLIMMLLMFIGGGPGSTAGGLKITTIAVISVFVYSTLKNEKHYSVFNRRFEEEGIKKACTVLMINLSILIIGIFLIDMFQPFLGLENIMYEVFSAIGTVGISTGITRALSVYSRVVIILLMYLGRVGTLTFVLMLTEERKVANLINPAETVAIG